MATTKWVKPQNKSEWPRYILDLGEKETDRWTVRLFADCEPKFANAKDGSWQYAAISYAWGTWHDKRTWADSSEAKYQEYPAFDAKISTTWKFPIVNKNMAFAPGPTFFDPVEPLFTMAEMKRALRRMKQRYVFWDWACLPQGSDAFLKTTIKGAAKPDPVTLAELQSVEVNKMRLIYPSSVAGMLWLHQTRFVADADQAAKGPVQKLFDTVRGIAVSSVKNVTAEAAEGLCCQMLAVQNTQASLVSVWSFQEGVLFGCPSRPQLFGATQCMVVDRSGNAYGDVVKKANGDPVDGLQNDAGDYVGDIVQIATFIVSFIIDALVQRSMGVPLDKAAKPLTRWAYYDEKSARNLLTRFISTGMVGFMHDNPLLLLEAKWTRTYKSPFSAKTDRCIRAIIGGLDIDLPADKLRDAAGKPDKEQYDLLLAPYLSSMVEGYQWRLFLQARGRETPAPAATANGTAATPVVKSWIGRLADVAKPPFASIDLYLPEGSQLTRTYKPRTARLAAAALESVLDLPKLEVDTSKAELPVVARAAKKAGDFGTGYGTYVLSKAAAAAGEPYKSCVFYDFVRGAPARMPDEWSDDPEFPYQPGTVRATRVGPYVAGVPKPDPDNPPKQFDAAGVATPALADPGILGTGVVALLPLEKLPKTSATALRCLVLEDFDSKATVAKGKFRGIVDVDGLDAKLRVDFTKDVEIW